MKMKNISRLAFLMLAAVHGTAAQAGESASAVPPAPGEKAWRTLFCESNGGRDVTDQGKLSTGPDVTAAVVCQYPESGNPRAAARQNEYAKNAVAGPIPTTPVSATLHPPSGSFSIAAGNPLAVSCSADLYIAPWAGLPARSNGTSTFNCRGYNVGQSSVGCNVQWSGPTTVAVGASPYGASASVNFTCAATHVGAISSVMDYSYRDPIYQRITYSAQNVFGTINIQP
ncbi:hypothetical protein [Burkholderia singularis]|uniref:Ig-like domain-containing protein n=1 Tax=Burkholderia singularis TaxID=1503053 RepID=A0A238H5L5_9BURK|nr:hypothetical protein [Burkholderia singularis]SMG00510.1 FIG00454237: hypothetical protein [Burkholderia singularis]